MYAAICLNRNDSDNVQALSEHFGHDTSRLWHYLSKKNPTHQLPPLPSPRYKKKTNREPIPIRLVGLEAFTPRSRTDSPLVNTLLVSQGEQQPQHGGSSDVASVSSGNLVLPNQRPDVVQRLHVATDSDASPSSVLGRAPLVPLSAANSLSNLDSAASGLLEGDSPSNSPPTFNNDDASPTPMDLGLGDNDTSREQTTTPFPPAKRGGSPLDAAGKRHRLAAATDLVGNTGPIIDLVVDENAVSDVADDYYKLLAAATSGDPFQPPTRKPGDCEWL